MDKDGMGDAALTLDDLVGSLKGTTAYGDVKKKIEGLSKGPAPLSSPMAAVVERRANRKTQYEETTKEVTRWMPLVQSHRRAKHISFSAEANRDIRPNFTVASLAAKFTPASTMEREVDAILKGGMGSTGRATNAGETALLASAEDHNDMPDAAPVDYEREREQQRELAKLRPRLFYEEQKRRRMNSIKSKAYRKIKKKQKVKQMEAERERLRIENPEEAARLDEEDAMAHARERMTLKHRNKGKWAQRVLRTGGVSNAGHREALNEHVNRAAELRLKMDRVNAKNSDSDSEEEESEMESEVDSDDSDAVRASQRKRAKKAALQLVKEVEGDDEDEDAPTKGLFSLKFMRDAAVRQRAKAKTEAMQLVKELEELDRPAPVSSEEEDDGDNEGEDGDDDDDVHVAVKGKGKGKGKATTKTQKKGDKFGKMSLGPVRVALPEEEPKTSDSRPRSTDPSDASPTASAPAPAPAPASTKQGKKEKKGRKARSAVVVEPEVVPPAEAYGGASSQKPGSAAASGAGANSKKAKRARNAAKKVEDEKAQALEAMLVAGEDGEDVEGAPEIPAAEQPSKAKKGKKKQKLGGGVSAAEAARQARAAEQEELVRRAFSGFGAEEADFDREKAELAEEDIPEVKETPSGWGSWAGLGAPTKVDPAIAEKKKAAEKLKKRSEILKKRKDGKSRGVIINEKRDKKMIKHLAADVPYPFTSRAEYERSLRAPVGREWNTMSKTKEETTPQVVTQAGLIIQPIKFTEQRLTLPPGADAATANAASGIKKKGAKKGKKKGKGASR